MPYKCPAMRYCNNVLFKLNNKPWIRDYNKLYYEKIKREESIRTAKIRYNTETFDIELKNMPLDFSEKWRSENL